ncbi:MAG: hypothetical protein KJ852_16255 [Gammaproteobacteria bacterium]|nr:hypothetical protein [Gammaproteobacteria bacterium]MBU0786775.1 hypothetical protein [Gammaproteobacteria bacterium]MBU0814019.1 hypothetical protein [Gammaproteobacteria bacterium]MBU1788508.1 hypothetical protein [Gammaproteobacteria bacterium]
MPLLGQAAMLLSFDVEQEAIAEHDDWHTHEHLPERLSIPGFVRGTRWVALRGQPRYLVIYEVEQLATLASAPYLERLNNPSPWTTKMMPHYRGMSRGFCSLTGSFGLGLGHVCQLIRFKPAAGAEAALSQWLTGNVLPGLPARPGLGSVHLFEGALTPSMTNEQRIRGADAGVDWALVLTAFRQQDLERLVQTDLNRQALEQQGATDVVEGLYRLDYALTEREAKA